MLGNLKLKLLGRIDKANLGFLLLRYFQDWKYFLRNIYNVQLNDSNP